LAAFLLARSGNNVLSCCICYCYYYHYSNYRHRQIIELLFDHTTSSVVKHYSTSHRNSSSVARFLIKQRFSSAGWEEKSVDGPHVCEVRGKVKHGIQRKILPVVDGKVLRCAADALPVPVVARSRKRFTSFAQYLNPPGLTKRGPEDLAEEDRLNHVANRPVCRGSCCFQGGMAQIVCFSGTGIARITHVFEPYFAVPTYNC